MCDNEYLAHAMISDRLREAEAQGALRAMIQQAPQKPARLAGRPGPPGSRSGGRHPPPGWLSSRFPRCGIGSRLAACTSTRGSGRSPGASAAAHRRRPCWSASSPSAAGVARLGPARLAARPVLRRRVARPRCVGRVALTAGVIALRGAARVRARDGGARDGGAGAGAAAPHALRRTSPRSAPPTSSRARTGDVMLSMVEGVQQLETYFGQYLPQLFVAALTPLLIFAFVAFIDLPVALVLLGAALVALLAPALWHKLGQPAAASPPARLRRLRRRVPRLDPGPGARSRRSARAARAAGSCEERGARPVPPHHVGARHQHAGARHHRHRHRARRGGGAGARRLARGGRRDGAAALLIILMLGVEVFRPLRELRTVLHQGMLGLSAARGHLRAPRRRSRRCRTHAAGTARPALDAGDGLRGRHASRYPGGAPRRA